MCGIVGILNLDGRPFAAEDLLWRMTRALAHRGPDDEGIHVDGPVGLGQRRLSILDLSPAGHQPMLDEARGLATVYNGEIYNYRELRAGLAGGGPFQTSCDTEVLLRAAAFDQTKWLHAFNGMFAFAIWDARGRRLMLARDRLGIKPLYWTVAGGDFLFASEIKALLAHPAVTRRTRADAIPEYLAYRSLAGDATLLEGIRQCLPGHVLHVAPGAGEPRAVRWWDDATAADAFGPAAGDRAAQFDELFASAIRYRLISDVPVGTYNSGGVDSSLVTAAVRGQTTGALHTFSVGFDETAHDESRYARVVAERIGTEHHSLVMRSAEYADTLPEALWFCEAPLDHAHTVPLLHLSRLAKQYVTVVLTGEGADELFAGYPRYQIPLLAKRLRHVPRLLTRPCLAAARLTGRRRLVKLLELCGDETRATLDGARWVGDEALRNLGVGPATASARGDILARIQATPLDPLERVLAFDRGSYLPSLLHRLDRTTMASGIEARVPFLDYRLLAWSKTLRPGEKLRLGRENKVLLKQLATRTFPREMIYRRKMGFDVPIGAWLRDGTGLGRYLDLLTDATFRGRGTFDSAAVEKLVHGHRRNAADHSDILWALVNLELWHRMFVDAPGRHSSWTR